MMRRLVNSLERQDRYLRALPLPLLNLSRAHVHQQVNHTIGVTPLVVVPRNDLEESLLTWQIVLQSCQGVIDGGVWIVNEIRRNQILVGVAEDALQVSVGGFLQKLVDHLDACVLLGCESQ